MVSPDRLAVPNHDPLPNLSTASGAPSQEGLKGDEKKTDILARSVFSGLSAHPEASSHTPPQAHGDLAKQNNRCYIPPSSMWSEDHSQGTATCNICNFTCLNIQSFRAPHQANHRKNGEDHSQDPLYPCGFHFQGQTCCEAFDSFELRSHHLITRHKHNHHKDCPVPTCTASFRPPDLLQHVNIDHRNVKLQCPYCYLPNNLTAITSLHTHLLQIHNTYISIADLRDQFFDANTGFIIEKKDSTATSANEAVGSPTAPIPRTNSRCYPPRSANWKLDPNEFIAICRACGKSHLNIIEILGAHEKSHNPDKIDLYPCGYHENLKICDRTFPSFEERTLHLQQDHNGHIDNDCSIATCHDKISPGGLATHIHHRHKNTTLSCRIEGCEVTARSLYYLQRHIYKEHGLRKEIPDLMNQHFDPNTGLLRTAEQRKRAAQADIQPSPSKRGRRVEGIVEKAAADNGLCGLPSNEATQPSKRRRRVGGIVAKAAADNGLCGLPSNEATQPSFEPDVGGIHYPAPLPAASAPPPSTRPSTYHYIDLEWRGPPSGTSSTSCRNWGAAALPHTIGPLFNAEPAFEGPRASIHFLNPDQSPFMDLLPNTGPSPDLQDLENIPLTDLIPLPAASPALPRIASVMQNSRCYRTLSDLWDSYSTTTVICKICRGEFLNTPSIIGPHEETHRPKEQVRYPCGFHFNGELCAMEFPTLLDRNSHLGSVHGHKDEFCPDRSCKWRLSLQDLPAHIHGQHKQQGYRCVLEGCQAQLGTSFTNLRGHYMYTHKLKLLADRYRKLSFDPLTGLQYIVQPQMSEEELKQFARDGKLKGR